MTNRFRAGAAAAVALVSASLGAQQADRSHTEALSRRAADRLNALQAEADRLASQERTLIGDLRRLEIDREVKTETLRTIEERVATASAELASIDEQVSRLDAQRASAGPDLKARIIELYKVGQGRYLKLLLSVSAVGRIGQASRMVAALAAQDRQRILTYQERLAELKASRETLERRRREFDALRAEAEQARLAADRAVTARNELIRKIDSERDLNAQFAGELEAARQKLQTTLRGLTGGSKLEAQTLPLRPFRGDLDWPVGGTVRTFFGRTGSPGGPTANGVEIGAPEGSTVSAVHDGTVVFAGPFTGLGNLVIVDHGAQSFSLYGDLMDISVSRNTRIARGEQLGRVGLAPTGSSGVYFELRIDGRPVDPLQWLKKK